MTLTLGGVSKTSCNSFILFWDPAIRKIPSTSVAIEKSHEVSDKKAVVSEGLYLKENLSRRQEVVLMPVTNTFPTVEQSFPDPIPSAHTQEKMPADLLLWRHLGLLLTIFFEVQPHFSHHYGNVTPNILISIFTGHTDCNACVFEGNSQRQTEYAFSLI